MKDEKFLKAVKNFCIFQEDNFNLAKKLKLKQCSFTDMLLKATIAESSGGNCYGGVSGHYEKSESQIKDELMSNLKYAMSYLSEYLKDDYVDVFKKYFSENYFNSIKEYRESFDYYGNGYYYGVFQINFMNLMKDLLDNSKYVILKSYVYNEKSKYSKKLHYFHYDEKMKDLEKKIKVYDQEKEKELEEIKYKIKSLKENLEKEEKRLSFFDIEKERVFKSLKDELEMMSKQKI